jgi:predicted dithiol-disulfide oxidoreductase (DUF899 family)
MNATENAIEIRDLTKVYGKHIRAVDRLNLTVRRGEVYGFLGPNGAGKTGKGGPTAEWAALCGTDWATYTREGPGMSAFALEEGVVHHTYSAYARGLDGLWGMYQWLDRAPRGRNETSTAGLNWFRRHDEYDSE